MSLKKKTCFFPGTPAGSMELCVLSPWRRTCPFSRCQNIFPFGFPMTEADPTSLLTLPTTKTWLTFGRSNLHEGAVSRPGRFPRRLVAGSVQGTVATAPLANASSRASRLYSTTGCSPAQPPLLATSRSAGATHRGGCGMHCRTWDDRIKLNH